MKWLRFLVIVGLVFTALPATLETLAPRSDVSDRLKFALLAPLLNVASV